jgi:CBS domain-containing protein
MHVRTILRDKGSEVETIDQTATIADAAQRLRDRGIGALVVSGDGSSIEGIVSERDLVRSIAAHGASALGRSVGATMSVDVVTCSVEDDVDRLMGLMTQRRIRHLPVVDDEGRLTGIISIGDVVKARQQALEHENQALYDYLTTGR